MPSGTYNGYYWMAVCAALAAAERQPVRRLGALLATPSVCLLSYARFVKRHMQESPNGAIRNAFAPPRD